MSLCGNNSASALRERQKTFPPPLTVKGLYYKVEVNDKFANRQYLTISNYVIIKSITKISFVFAKEIFFYL